MDLPIRLVSHASDERLVSVDGAWDQPGLNLSHWPGNQTPADLRRDLSTEIVLAFGRLPAERRVELARGCTAIANNHYDTDGLCALFAARHPARARRVERALVEAARAGDFFAVPDERSFQVDVLLTGLVDRERSPWSARFSGASDDERREIVARDVVDVLDELLASDLESFAGLWRAPLERLRLDRAALAAATRDDVRHLDLSVFTSRAASFDPGRHALFGSTSADRVLAIGERRLGATYRLLIGTRSWFDLASPRPLPRPDMETLSARLNEIEGTAQDAEVAWRTQPTLSPSPELWFGREQAQFFAEHAPGLEPSRLAPRIVRREIQEALRATWTFQSD